MTAVMCWWRRFRRRHAVAKQEAQAAGRRAEEARRELEQSRQLLEQAREGVATLSAFDERNGYSDLIRDALSVGRQHKRGLGQT